MQNEKRTNAAPLAWPEDAEIKLGRREKGDYIDVTEGVDFKKPTLLALPGGSACDTRKANGFAKVAQQLIGRSEIYDDKLQIISASYPTHPDDRGRVFEDGRIHNQKFSSGEERNYQPYVEKLVSKSFMQLVTNEDGQRIDNEIAKENLRNINVLTYSFGGMIIDEIGNALYDKMVELGYATADIDDITSQLVVVTTASASNYGSCKANFTRLHILNLGDERVVENSENDDLVIEILNEIGRADKPLTVIKLENENENVAVVTNIRSMARVDETGSVWDKDGNFFSMDLDLKGKRFREYPSEKVEFPAYDDPKGHGVYTYMSYGVGEHGQMVPNMIANTLTNGINNSIANFEANFSYEATGLPNIDALMQPPRQVRFQRASIEDVGVYSAPESVSQDIGYVGRVAAAIVAAPSEHQV